MLSVTDSDFT